MARIVGRSVNIQTTSDSHVSIPSWCGDVVVITNSLHTYGVLSTINEQVRIARKRYRRCDVLDVLALFFGNAISGKRTREEFSRQLHSCAVSFIALYGRARCPPVRRCPGLSQQ
jgi:hypothetical protein